MDSILEFFKIILLGMIQGITEPIPISSSGHIIIIEHFLNISFKGLQFEVFLNTASLLAVLIIYRNDMFRLISNSFQYSLTRDNKNKNDFYFSMYILIATIPAAFIGIIFGDFIAEHFKSLKTIGFSLIITAVALWLIRNLKGNKKDSEITVKDAIIIGIAQCLALLPGISRSGSTIVTSMLLGTKQDTALRFSFLMYIPVSIGGIILEFNGLLSSINTDSILAYTISFIICFITSYFSLKFFISVMEKGKLIYFSIYCLVLGVILIL